MRREVDELPVPALPCPSLAPQVFAAIPPSVAFDIEVRAALSRSPPPPLKRGSGGGHREEEGVPFTPAFRPVACTLQRLHGRSRPWACG